MKSICHNYHAALSPSLLEIHKYSIYTLDLWLYTLHLISTFNNCHAQSCETESRRGKARRGKEWIQYKTIASSITASQPEAGCGQMCPGVAGRGGCGRIEARQNKGPTMPSPLDGHYSNMRAELTLLGKGGKCWTGKIADGWAGGWGSLSQPPNVTRTLQVAVSVGERLWQADRQAGR